MWVLPDPSLTQQRRIFAFVTWANALFDFSGTQTNTKRFDCEMIFTGLLDDGKLLWNLLYALGMNLSNNKNHNNKHNHNHIINNNNLFFRG